MAGASIEECERLYEYGNALGVAFQLHDDYLSIWGNQRETGKIAHGDIVEKKKTLPIIHARDTLSDADRDRLCSLYAALRSLTESETEEVVTLVDRSGAQKYVEERIRENIALARSACSTLSLSEQQKAQLASLAKEIL